MSSVFNSAWSRIWHLHPGNHCNLLKTVARSERFELPTFWSVARRSIQLSYERVGVKDDCLRPDFQCYRAWG